MINSKINNLKKLRLKLSSGNISIGTWIQLNSSDTAEILAFSNYDWIVIDMEHGSICGSDLPDIIRSIELGGSIPLVRISHIDENTCKSALDAGAYGLILPMVKNVADIERAVGFSCWPPKGRRGVGYSRANLYGKFFESYKKISQLPFIVAQIENKYAVDDLENILKSRDLDAVIIGPYDLAASIEKKIDFNSKKFLKTIKNILTLSKKYKMPCGIHQVKPDKKLLKKYISDGYNFIAYSTDAYFLIESSINPMERK